MAGEAALGRAVLELSTDDKKFNAGLDEATKKTKGLGANLLDAKKQTKDFGDQLSIVGKTAQTVGAGLTAAFTLPIVGAGAVIAKLGMDAVESRNLIEVSFGSMTSAADAWAKNLSDTLGLNRFETEKMAGTLFNMTTGMGFAKDAAFDMSTGVVKLAADMSSFRNIPMEEALTKIKSGLTGEAEPLKAIGILVDDATIKTFAYTNGIAKQGAELTQQQKVLARWGAILKQTGNDQGDLARTLESPANQLRIMKSRVEEAATALGVSLVPIMTSAIGVISSIVPYIQAAAEWFAKLPEPVKLGAVGLLAIAAAAGPVLLIFGTVAGAITTLLPLLKTLGITSAGVGTAMSTAGIAALAFGAAIAGWEVGSWIAKLKLFGDAQMSIGESFEFGATKISNWARGVKASDADIETAILSRRKLTTETKAAVAPTEDAAAAYARMVKGFTAGAAPSKEVADALEKIRTAAIPLTEAQQRQAVANERLGVSAETTAKALGISADAVQTYLESLKNAKEIADTWEKAHRDMAEASSKFIRKAIDEWQDGQQKIADASGKAIADQLQQAAKYRQELENATRSGTAYEVEQIETKRDAEIAALNAASTVRGGTYQADLAAIKAFYQNQIDVANGTASTIEQRMRAQGVATRGELEKTASDARRDYEQMRDSGVFTAAELQAAWERWYAADQATRSTWAGRFSADLQTIVGAFTNLAQIAGGAMSNVARGIGTVLSSLDLGVKGLADMKKGFAAFKDGQALSGIASMATGIGGIVAAAMAAVQGIKAIWSALDRNKGRDLVVDFADSMGGFDALHAKLLELGDAGEKLWIKMTQGTPKGDPKAAQAVIDEVTKALDEQAAKQGEATQATEEGAQATIETATQASAALDALGPKIDENKAAWASWSDDVTADVNRLAAALRAITLPAPGGSAGPALPPVEGMADGGFGRVTRPTLFYSGGDEDYAFSGEGRSFGMSAIGSRPIEITNVTQLDGRTVARNQARHLPNELERVGVRSR
jgi:predicted transcriptional regulator